jgi:hypothetical protein
MGEIGKRLKKTGWITGWSLDPGLFAPGVRGVADGGNVASQSRNVHWIIRSSVAVLRGVLCVDCLANHLPRAIMMATSCYIYGYHFFLHDSGRLGFSIRTRV